MNEIKVGQWARGYCSETEFKQMIIGKINKIVGNCLVINDDYWLVNGYGFNPKTADNLVDLIVVGDIVHFRYLHNFTDEWRNQMTDRWVSKEISISGQFDLNRVKKMVKNKEWIITFIELKENRVKQKV